MNDHSPADTTRSPLGLLAPVLRRWPLLLLLAAAGGVAAFLWFSTKPPVYEATARLQVSKRYESAASDGRALFLEDYVATMTQIIVSDEVLGEAWRTLRAAQLAFPLPDDQTAGLDVIKGSLAITRVRDPNAVATTSSSVLSLRYVSGDPGDCKKALDAVNAAVGKYLARGVSEAMEKQKADLAEAISGKTTQKNLIENQLLTKRRELNAITLEDLAVLRSRITSGRERAFSLDLEMTVMDRDLTTAAKAGQGTAARMATLRQVLGTARTGGDAAVGAGPDTLLAQLNARRLELSERVGKDHPAMLELDGQIQFHQKMAGQTAAGDGVDELALFEGRLKERKAAAAAQLAKVNEQVDKDEKNYRKAAELQDTADLLRRQLDEYNLEIGRQKDRQEALAASISSNEKSSRAYEARELDKPRLGRKIGPVLTSWLFPGVLLGLFAGVGLAYLAELADQSFRSPAEIRNRLGVPVFGHIAPIQLDKPATADVSAAYDPSLVVARRPKSVEAEMYRAVRARVLVSAAAGGHKVIQVTSPNPGDGKSTTAANLAISLAQAGKRVALIDADFRKPRVHRMFALARPEVGLASVVDGSTDLDAAIRPCDVDNLFLMPCGPRPANPAELLAGERFAEVLAELKGRFDHVIIDTPPLLVISDPLVVAQRADAVVLVFGINRRSRPQVERAKELLTDTGATLIGVVINGMELPATSYGYSPASYKYAYSYEYKYTDSDGSVYGDPDDASRT